MRNRDLIHFTFGAVIAHRLRSFLTALGIAIGIAAVVLLTSIGEGVHRFVLDEFTQFGTTLVAINPGKVTTHGTTVGVFGSVRPLTIDDSEALRRVPHATAVVPALQGNAEIEAGKRPAGNARDQACSATTASRPAPYFCSLAGPMP